MRVATFDDIIPGVVLRYRGLSERPFKVEAILSVYMGSLPQFRVEVRYYSYNSPIFSELNDYTAIRELFHPYNFEIIEPAAGDGLW